MLPSALRYAAVVSLALGFALPGCTRNQPAGSGAAGDGTHTDTDTRGAMTENETARPGDSAASIRAAVDAPERPADDRARDGDRRPADVLAFFGVAPGMKVADLMTGRGYYAEILARVVGPEGAVYAQNNRFVVERFADKPLNERLARMGLKQVIRWDRELNALELPEGQLDVIQMVLFYHDTFWQNVDRAAMNREIFKALKPGGIYGVIDHHAAAGAGDSQVNTLHRVEASVVKKDILAAGFEFVGESDILAHPEDNRQTNVFSDEIRGKTDRFVFKFRKPQ